MYKVALIIGYLFLLISSAHFSTRGEVAAKVQEKERISIKNDEGWIIPLLKGSTIGEKKKTTFPGSPPVPVEIIIYHPKKPPKQIYVIHELPLFFVNGNKVRISKDEFGVSHIVQYSTPTKKIFCYIVSCYELVETRFGKELAAAKMNFFYFDTDGDGKFETLEYGTVLTREPLPEWVIPDK